MRFWKEYIDYVIGVWHDPTGNIQIPGTSTCSYGTDFTAGTSSGGSGVSIGSSGPDSTIYLNGLVTPITNSDAGSGYTSAPTVTFSTPPAAHRSRPPAPPPFPAGRSPRITLTSLGSGYTSIPTITLNGGGYTTQRYRDFANVHLHETRG